MAALAPAAQKVWTAFGLEATREVVAALTGKPRVRRQRAPRLVETPPEAPEPAQREMEGAA